MDDPDPYAVPHSAGEAGPVSTAALAELVKGWEKLRLVYNAVLLLPGIGALAIAVGVSGLPIPFAILMALVSGTAANAAFFMGPLAELYIRGLFLRGRPAPHLRRFLLIGGLFISFGAMGLFVLGSPVIR